LTDFQNSYAPTPIKLGGLGINKDDVWEKGQDRIKRIKEFSNKVYKVNTYLDKISFFEKPKKKKELSAR
jgi:hypothetical protein